MSGHVLLVSADDWLRCGLSAALRGSKEGSSRCRVSDFRSAVEALAACRPDVDIAVLDASGADMAVTAWCSEATRRSDAPILVMHDDADVELLTSCLEAGASGFQTKDLTLPELVSAMSAVRRGEAVVPRRLLGALLGNLIRRRRRDDEAAAKYDRLTSREREILTMIADGQDRESIARTLFISPQTARTHIQNVLGKLAVHSRIEAAQFAHAHGYARLPGRTE